MLKRIRRLIDTIQSLGEAEALLGQLARAFLAAQSNSQVTIAGLTRSDEERAAVMVLDEAGRIVWIDKNGEGLLDRPSSAVVGHALTEFLAPPGLETRVHVGGAARSQFPESLLLVRADGSRVRVKTRLANFQLQTDCGLVVTLTVDAPAQSHRGIMAMAHYRALVEQIPAVTFMAAFDGSLAQLYVSPQIESLLGFTQEEWLEDPILWFRQLHPDDLEIVHREFARGVSTGGPFKAVLRVFTRDGRIVWVRGEARVIRDENGEPLFFQGVAFDVTEAKSAEEQLHEMHELKLRNERLAAIGQVAASVSHDLRNPLGSIRNGWYYIRRKLEASNLFRQDARVQRFSDVIENEIARCSKIIGDLLDFTRVPPLERTHISLPSLLAEVRAAISKPPSVRIVEDLHPGLPLLYIDPHRFGQALINVLENAVDAVDPAQGIVSIRARFEKDAVLIEVADNGKGISPNDQARIFEPLFTTKMKGTGLGLSIVHHIVERHGATISVKSVPGSGTAFCINLPIGQRALNHEQPVDAHQGEVAHQ